MAQTKVFKSRNSMAVRLPASFKAVPGAVVEVREAQGQRIVEPVGEPKRYIDVAAFYGLCPDMEPITDRSFDECPSKREQREAAERHARDAGAAETYSSSRFKRRSYDRLIGAHALALGLTLVTAEEADFTDIPGPQIEDWTRE